MECGLPLAYVAAPGEPVTRIRNDLIGTQHGCGLADGRRWPSGGSDSVAMLAKPLESDLDWTESIGSSI